MSMLWALFVSSAFPIGALISTYVRIPLRVQADLAATSSGIFIGTISFSLIDNAVKVGSSEDLIIGFVGGLLVFSFGDYFIKRAAERQSREGTGTDAPDERNAHEKSETGGKAQSVILGTLIDSTPETIFVAALIALPLAGLVPSALALFLGNITATIEGTKRLYNRGARRSIVLYRWTVVFGIVFAAGPIGYFVVM